MPFPHTQHSGKVKLNRAMYRKHCKTPVVVRSLCSGTVCPFCCPGPKRRKEGGSSKNTKALETFPNYWRPRRNVDVQSKEEMNQESCNKPPRAAILYDWYKHSQLHKEQEKCGSPHKPSTNQRDREEAPWGQTMEGQLWSPHQHGAQALFGVSRDAQVFPGPAPQLGPGAHKMGLSIFNF